MKNSLSIIHQDFSFFGKNNRTFLADKYLVVNVIFNFCNMAADSWLGNVKLFGSFGKVTLDSTSVKYLQSELIKQVKEVLVLLSGIFCFGFANYYQTK